MHAVSIRFPRLQGLLNIGVWNKALPLTDYVHIDGTVVKVGQVRRDKSTSTPLSCLRLVSISHVEGEPRAEKLSDVCTGTKDERRRLSA